MTCNLSQVPHPSVELTFFYVTTCGTYRVSRIAPLRRKPGSERGGGGFEGISWDTTFQMMEERLAHLLTIDLKRFVFGDVYDPIPSRQSRSENKPATP